MRIAAHRGNRLHAPENTLAALISGYTAGADTLAFDVQLSADGHALLCHDADTLRVTGQAGVVGAMTLAQLRALDFSRTFAPRGNTGFAYYRGERRMAPETLHRALEKLPEDAELLIRLVLPENTTPDSAASARREALARTVAAAVADHAVGARSVLCTGDPALVRLLREALPGQRLAGIDESDAPEQLWPQLREAGADGIVVALEAVLVDAMLTASGRRLREAHAAGQMPLGVLVFPRGDRVFDEAQWHTLRREAFVHTLGTASMCDVAFCRRPHIFLDADFSGRSVDREDFAFGYAKANRYAVVEQDDGVHIRIEDYAFPPAPIDPLDVRLRPIEHKLVDVAREWPYYSGGGVGCVRGVRGDFCAEIDYTVARVAQATTLEMAALNVDPGAHRGQPPRSFRDKDSFYDPHGAPPYVGVEHDEDDGLRINWNLGTEYDSNQYGRPVGDGTALAGRLRLERRGAYFSAYYRNDRDATDWVCCGTARNDSLNPVVYLRCVGKRWRQESEADPSVFLPVIPNHFVFRNWKIVRYPQSSRSD